MRSEQFSDHDARVVLVHITRKSMLRMAAAGRRPALSQGDGEITFCGAIEMGGYIDLHVDLIKGGMETYGVTTNPVFFPGNVEPRYSEYFDIRPSTDGPERADRGRCATTG